MGPVGLLPSNELSREESCMKMEYYVNPDYAM